MSLRIWLCNWLIFCGKFYFEITNVIELKGNSKTERPFLNTYQPHFLFLLLLFWSPISNVCCCASDRFTVDLSVGWIPYQRLPTPSPHPFPFPLSFHFTFCWSLFAFAFYSISTSSPSFSSLILFMRGALSIILSPYISARPSFSSHLSASERERERERETSRGAVRKNDRELGGVGRDGQIRWQW